MISRSRQKRMGWVRPKSGGKSSDRISKAQSASPKWVRAAKVSDTGTSADLNNKKVAGKVRQGSNGRRQQAVKHARRAEQNRQTMTWLGKASGMTLIAALFTGIGYGVFFAARSGLGNWSALCIKSIEISGLSHLRRSQVLAAARIEVGDSWLFSRLGRSEERLVALPGIASAKVTRRFPSRILVEVDEAHPVALAKSESWMVLFSDGTLAEGEAWLDADVPVVESIGSMDRERRRLVCGFLGRVRREKPQTFTRFSQVTPLGGEDLAVILRDGQARVVLEPAVKSLNSLDFLETLLRDHAGSWRAGADIDLRVPNHAYVL